MEPLKVNGTSQYPTITLDKDAGVFEFRKLYLRMQNHFSNQ